MRSIFGKKVKDIMQKPKLSVVIPFYNEEDNLPLLHKEVVKVLSGISIKSEIIYINDGSQDSSLSKLKKSIAKNKGNIAVKVINLRKNLGQTAAISAGLDNCEGNNISFLDADMQNDPHDIPRFLEKMNEGYDAVFGWRKDRKDATFRSVLSKLANKV